MKTIENIIGDENIENLKSIEWVNIRKSYNKKEPKHHIINTVNEKNFIFYNDGIHVYPKGKIVENNINILTEENIFKLDENENVIELKERKTIKENKNNNNGNLYTVSDIETIYDEFERPVIMSKFDRSGKVYHYETYCYYGKSNIIQQKIIKGTDSIIKKYYNKKGNLIKIIQTTIKSGYSVITHRAECNSNGDIISEVDNSYKYVYNINYDDNNNILAKSTKIYNKSDNHLIREKINIYNTKFKNKLSKVIINGHLTEEYMYDTDGELVEFKIHKEGLLEDRTIHQETKIDKDTGEKTIYKRIRISNNDNTIINCYESRILDKDDKLLSYTRDDSFVQLYEYNEDGNRTKVITKKLINDKFIVINEVLYTYNDIACHDYKERTEYIYDENSKLVSKKYQINELDIDEENKTTTAYSDIITYNYIV